MSGARQRARSLAELRGLGWTIERTPVLVRDADHRPALHRGAGSVVVAVAPAGEVRRFGSVYEAKRWASDHPAGQVA